MNHDEELRELKRSAILQAAGVLFESRRFDEVKLDEVAAAAGVGKGTLYLYFKNKEDLFAQMAIEGLDSMIGRIREIAALDRSYKERLFLFAREFSTFLIQRHGVMRVMSQAQSDSIHKVFCEHFEPVIGAVQALLQTGVDEGILRSDVPVTELRYALMGPILLKIRRETPADGSMDLDALLELFWAGAAKENT